MKSQWCWSNEIIEFWFNNLCLDYYFSVFCFFSSRRLLFLWRQLQCVSQWNWNVDFFSCVCMYMCGGEWCTFPFVWYKYSICMQDLCPKKKIEIDWNLWAVRDLMILFIPYENFLVIKSISKFYKCNVRVFFYWNPFIDLIQIEIEFECQIKKE